MPVDASDTKNPCKRPPIAGHEAIRGRGAAENLPNRFEAARYAEEESMEVEPPESQRPKTQFWDDHSRSIIARNNSPDVGFGASFNPYRGCEHGCVYCYARPTHEYLGLSLGLDFETKILVKRDAPELLRKEFASKSWTPELLMVSGVTDCYQPVERELEITRRCLDVCLEFRNPVYLITKNFLITRDIDILKQMAAYNGVGVTLSVTTLDPKLCGILEPRTSRPEKRLEAIRLLSEAGVPVGVNVAPVVPGITDHEMPAILKAAREAGARSAAYVLLRLPYGVKDLFAEWLAIHYPERREKVLHRLEELRDGKLNDSTFGSRMRGQGVYAEQIRNQFQVWTKKLGFEDGAELSIAAFRRPHHSKGQTEMEL